MAKKAKKKKHDEHIDESWLVPYADILTLLLAVFIILFASSSVDQEKLERMSAVFNQVFDGGTSFLEQPAPVPTPNADSDQTPQQNSAYLKDQQELAEIKDSVDNFIAVNEMEGQFATEMTDEGLLVTIRDSILFDPGQATVKPEYVPIAKELSTMLESDPARNIVITGHTDNVPAGPNFTSNFQLSVMRATKFLELLIESNDKLDPTRFSAKGNGEYRAIAPNDTAEGRAKNRRVEVLIQPLVTEDGSET
ncbi:MULTISPECIES: flagellar motor protein MotB [unclassified Lysinibacillus]|uniref:flagellar motor protein MotB n=1 Tax=unclassified Lysinibacillus TaxID=2636778 RepID=UPI00103AFB63|nr:MULTISPECIES: flagellar motor protein MotB [unclassified Lysinibacillus]MCM0626557.1 flagellar motor protein MotB [Lysinibacillus sp. OL1_EC]MCS5503611.1 flagellar motor protein MotB [Lysinibacillus sp. A4]TBV85825.1 flagellar motor protein MotB [Lysinibacillus sp. OL1]UKJ44874.1 flagellar motor protein MotB [Lysinibacillus sp. ACHW1.5]WGT38289.1 flagellar motor protein MotB [Lysinibacillus sp. 1 U-2021]